MTLPPAKLPPALNWGEVLPDLSVSGVTRVLASHCYLASVEGNTLTFHLSSQHAALWNKAHEKRIERALSEVYGGHCRVAIELGDVAGETPAQAAERERIRALAEATEVIDSNHNVQALISNFDGTVIRDTIAPRAGSAE